MTDPTHDHLPKILFVVDGITERLSLTKKFTKDFLRKPNTRLGPGNGINFTTTGYAKGVMPILMMALSSSFHYIILIPDLEKRKVSFTEFAGQIKSACIDEMVSTGSYNVETLEEKIFVCPPDIMFENWIVSDITNVSEKSDEFSTTVIQENFDGQNGSRVLKKNMNIKYKKTVHGANFFCRTRFKHSKSNSKSFAHFIDTFHLLINQLSN